jgi:hypothetical protein
MRMAKKRDIYADDGVVGIAAAHVHVPAPSIIAISSGIFLVAP